MVMALKPTKALNIGPVCIGGGAPIALIAGPCVIESDEHAYETARLLKEVTRATGTPFIFKASYDKANRSSIDSFRGPGLTEGLKTLKRIKEELGLPVLSDIHSIEQIEPAAQVLDILQIPAFLCRQTDLLVAAAQTGVHVNVKKGQFMAPWDMKNVVNKLEQGGTDKILLTERGFMFGYNNLVTDFRSLILMRDYGYPIIHDATHSLQLPGGQGSKSGGQRELIPDMTRAAVAVGCDALFMEIHPEPDTALSDGPNMLRLDALAPLLETIHALDRIVKA
ncbi:MAG: 3-deoxy-8-phosphooctulonate synthase [Candidatus Nitrohelix vancouverensis]|uniref:2-dehydro-3-deoxyphosphooctonate aldolase n=1 Tax=Candidatus Nitrohelix vancouverensis TaxID=2705534 RepID=A0A7T0C5F3_9BACT|nr:MAG: 3-deoxy-8-phosphooctulonate synthase [Candidatus Nitrohelix vancouverensis]